MKEYKFKFIDLFAGIGGFHQAMRFLGGECLMASEINKECIKTYELNYETKDKRVRGDINLIDPYLIGNFDVLCAGFPCQPFSKAGSQKGFEDEERGNLFFKIMHILDAHPEVKFVILENVRNLADRTENWDVITKELVKRNFYITEKPIILSPTDFGLPQIRERVYILGINKKIKNNEILTNGCIHMRDLMLENYFKKCKIGSAWEIIEDNVSDQYLITNELELVIYAWSEFKQHIIKGIVGFPIWIQSFGVNIDSDDEFYGMVNFNELPAWKKKFVKKNRELYIGNRLFIDKWLVKHNMLSKNKLYQKFEWNCGSDVIDIKEAIIQVRQSGIRVKRPDYFPSLVALVNTPIIWDKSKSKFRYITHREAANLQNFDKRFKFDQLNKTTYKQLGNSVNVRVVKILGKQLLALAKEGWEDE